jgi:hypothetical protein
VRAASRRRAIASATGDTTLDYGALAAFLRLGFFLGGDTPTRRFARCLPGAALSWSTAGPRFTCAYAILTRPLTVSRDEAIAAFLATFEPAIAARLPDASFQLPLSGGRDSRPSCWP